MKNIDDPRMDNELTRQAIVRDQAFNIKSDQFHRGHKELPPGRNFLWNTFRERDKADLCNYRKNFDLAFPDAPGAGF